VGGWLLEVRGWKAEHQKMNLHIIKTSVFLCRKIRNGKLEEEEYKRYNAEVRE
jgi:hypothetical protein